MNTFLRLALNIWFLGHFTSAVANFQPHTNEVENASKQKTYVSFEKLHFSQEGIFVKNTPGSWTKVEYLGYDTEGYYVLTGIFDGLFRQQHYIAKCRNCSTEYQNRSPQPCEVCDVSVGFDVVYIEDSYWDRNG